MKIRPQVLAAIITIGLLGAMVIIVCPEYTDKVVGSAITGIGMLAMKLIDGE